MEVKRRPSKYKTIPRVFTTKNLLYVIPDVNKRHVYMDWEEVAVVDADPNGWSKDNQRELDDIVLALQACP